MTTIKLTRRAALVALYERWGFALTIHAARNGTVTISAPPFGVVGVGASMADAFAASEATRETIERHIGESLASRKAAYVSAAGDAHDPQRPTFSTEEWSASVACVHKTTT